MTTMFTTLAIAAANMPEATTGAPSPHLLGYSLLTAQQCGNGWVFNQCTEVAQAENETSLLEQLGDQLPHPARLIGWQLADRTLAPLAAVVRHAAPIVAYHVMARLERLLTSPTIDLSIDAGDAAVPDLETMARAQRLPLRMMDDRELFDAWSFSRFDPVRTSLADEARLLWQLWLNQGGTEMAAARAATQGWFTSIAW